jgi:hypothetical protein
MPFFLEDGAEGHIYEAFCGHVDCGLSKVQLTSAKIDGQAQSLKKVQPQQSIDSSTRR